MTLLTSWVHRYTLRDLLDDSFDLFKERGITLLMAGALPYILVVAYQALMRFYVLPGNFLRDYSDINSLLGNAEFWLYLCGLSLVSAIAFAISLLAQSRVAVAHVLGETVSWHQVYRGSFVQGLRLIGLTMIYSLLLSVATAVALMIAFFIFALLMLLFSAFGLSPNQPAGGMTLAITMIALFYLVLMLATVLLSTLFLAAPVLVAHERYGVFAALAKSFRYASVNYKANVVALYVLLHLPILFTILAAGLQMLLMFSLQYIAPAAAEAAGLTITLLVSSLSFSAIVACQSALTYVDGKCRLEALDLQLMAQDMGLEAELAQAFHTPAAPAPTTYPVYSTTSVPGAGATNYLATTPPVSGAPLYPDYSVPPPALEAAAAVLPDTPAAGDGATHEPDFAPPAPGAWLAPDYSAPPPTFEATAAVPPHTPSAAEATQIAAESHFLPANSTGETEVDDAD